jgi:hypothetical protein
LGSSKKTATLVHHQGFAAASLAAFLSDGKWECPLTYLEVLQKWKQLSLFLLFQVKNCSQ